MRFGPVAVGEAEGAVLAHATAAGAVRFRKAHRLTVPDIALLEAAGVRLVIAARLDGDDFDEDAAATAIATALAAAGTDARPAATGRVNLYARWSGVFTVERPLIEALNRIDPAITVATLAEYEAVEAGQMVATAKIIPFAVSDLLIREARALLNGSTAFAVHPFRPKRIALVQTVLADNRLGKTGDGRDDTAVARVRRFRRNGREAPAPIKACPWCSTPFGRDSFSCTPSDAAPQNMEVRCANATCDFTRDRPLPVLTVDEAIYRRLPAFLIATVDKFAGLPWVGPAGGFFGHVDRTDEWGFYGAAEPGRGRKLWNGQILLPPDLIVQDELHLISGPLGTVAALYETALDALASREWIGRKIRPKIVASTATVRRAKAQVTALFDRERTAVFPPPSPDRRDSFFAVTATSVDRPARLYVGLASPGRGPKLIFLRALTTLLAASHAEAMRGGDPRDTQVVCDCGSSLTLEDLFQPFRLGPCRGDRPWIADTDPLKCDAPRGLRLLTRSATNTYFPQVVSVISLPQAEDELSRRIEENWAVLEKATSAVWVGIARDANPNVGAALKGYSDEEVFARIQQLKAATSGEDAARDPRIAEFELFSNGRRLIGENAPHARLHAETLDRRVWDTNDDPLLGGIGSLVAVHRLREVSCLYGFTRFEPSVLATDDLEDVGLAVDGAPLGRSPTWLPAVEMFGEGIFLTFDPSALQSWLSSTAMLARAKTLSEGASAWARAPSWLSPAIRVEGPVSRGRNRLT